MSFPRRAIRSYTVGTTLYATGSAVPPPAACHFMHHDTRSRTVTAPALLLTLVCTAAPLAMVWGAGGGD